MTWTLIDFAATGEVSLCVRLKPGYEEDMLTLDVAVATGGGPQRRHQETAFVDGETVRLKPLAPNSVWERRDHS